MNTENKEQEVKIKIVKEEEPKKERKFFNPEKLAVFFFYPSFLSLLWVSDTHRTSYFPENHKHAG